MEELSFKNKLCVAHEGSPDVRCHNFKPEDGKTGLLFCVSHTNVGVKLTTCGRLLETFRLAYDKDRDSLGDLSFIQLLKLFFSGVKALEARSDFRELLSYEFGPSFTEGDFLGREVLTRVKSLRKLVTKRMSDTDSKKVQELGLKLESLLKKDREWKTKMEKYIAYLEEEVHAQMRDDTMAVVELYRRVLSLTLGKEGTRRPPPDFYDGVDLLSADPQNIALTGKEFVYAMRNIGIAINIAVTKLKPVSVCELTPIFCTENIISAASKAPLGGGRPEDLQDEGPFNSCMNLMRAYRLVELFRREKRVVIITTLGHLIEKQGVWCITKDHAVFVRRMVTDRGVTIILDSEDRIDLSVRPQSGDSVEKMASDAEQRTRLIKSKVLVMKSIPKYQRALANTDQERLIEAVNEVTTTFHYESSLNPYPKNLFDASISNGV
jgi:hypothetical protein